MQLGKKIRDMRFRRGLTVQQLADLSGLSKGFISQVENARTSPSLATLRDLARALNTSVAYLVVEDDASPHIVRESDRARVGSSSPIRLELLTAQPRRNLEMVMASIPPGASTGTERGYHHGEECVVCLDGRVAVVGDDHRTILEVGDSCHYDGRTPHSVENVGETMARVLVAVTPASFEPATRLKASPDAVAAPTSEVGAPG
jgi:transcriptional regulator with XRE-family HTH domain